MGYQNSPHEISMWYNVHSCVCIYIYGWMCVGLCVLSVAGGIIFNNVFKATSECLEVLPLSVLARRPYEELCPHEPARPEVRGKKDEGHWSDWSETPTFRESHSQDRGEGIEGSPGVKRQHRRWPVGNRMSSGENNDQR